ncbi:MAG: DUF3078 domain-containing protein [Bacteroidales bacterium]|nr:DUF3078 domain-containing protein [Bacteroidales bacterium]
MSQRASFITHKCHYIRVAIAFTVCMVGFFATEAYAQKYTFRELFLQQRSNTADTTAITFPLTSANDVCLDRDLFDVYTLEEDSAAPRPVAPLPIGYYRPVVYDEYPFLDTLTIYQPQHEPVAAQAFQWLDDIEGSTQQVAHARRSYLVNQPFGVKYLLWLLPEKPENLDATVDATVSKIEMREYALGNKVDEVKETIDKERINWIQTFNGSVHFSQTYVSPNWYQGGNNNLVILINALYNIKLNQKFYPKLLFDTTVQYKLGLNSAPDDSLRSYNISEDLFQINSTFGYKAASRWYYSATLYFKTQFLNNYASNSRDLKAAILSPGELNVGLGMTYDYTNPKKTFTIGASISPLAWNMKTCFNSRIDETLYDIKEGHHTVSQFGSSAEIKIAWKIAYNISYSTRLFAFTDYDYFQGDWEHTLNFDINRYLSTSIYAHLRYDTSSPRYNDHWHQLQIKEILSFGFQYKFETK